MQKRLYVIWILLISGLSLVMAEGNGGFSGAFLRIGLGARALAMGNAQVASANNGYGIYYNPAALPNIDRKRFSASYNSMSLDRKFSYLGIAIPLKPFAGASAGWIHSGVGNLLAYNSNGEQVGELDHGFNAFYFGFGMRIIALAQADQHLMGLPSDLISIGIAVKFLHEGLSDKEDFDYSGSGVGVDLGVLLKPYPGFALGYQLKDLNANLSSNTDKIFERGSSLDNDFPVTQKVGIFYRLPWYGISAAYDFEWSDVGEEKHHVGMEINGGIAAARIGYDNDHLTLGGGLYFRAYKKAYMMLDYAFLSSVIDEGVSHVFSWQFLF